MHVSWCVCIAGNGDAAVPYSCTMITHPPHWNQVVSLDRVDRKGVHREDCPSLNTELGFGLIKSIVYPVMAPPQQLS